MTERAPPVSPEPPAADVAPEALCRALAGRYVLEGELGRGGMGTVLRARDVRHDRLVAIKVLAAELATAVGAGRFLREVRTAGSLLHPGIVTVYDSGEAGGLLYYVMPLVEGESLRARLDRAGPLPVAEAVRVACQVAEALAFAHARGIVHRDIKPENILLAAHGHAQVTDFGVARVLSEADAHLTRTGAFVGSALYLSPEQASGAWVDGRADVYSLGCVLYEMLAGVPPFHGPTLNAVLIGHLTADPPRLHGRRPDVPPALEAVVQRTLAKSPDHRFATAAELAEALRPDAATSSPPARARLLRPLRRRTLAAVAIVLALVGIAIAKVLEGDRLRGVVASLAGRVPAPDTTRYAVFPFRRDPAVTPALAEADRVRDGLARWQGLDVIDPGDAAAVFARGDSAGVDPARARRLARALRAGRFVTGRITREGDSLRIYAEVGDVASDAAHARLRLVVPAANPEPSATFAALADSIALAGVRAACLDGAVGTRSLPAVRACDRAFAALDDGEVAPADSLFRHALQADARYARAALWLAQSRDWLVDHPPPARELMAVVNAGRAALSPRERTLADALAQMDAGRYADACRAYSALTAADSLDVAAWLGLGECHRRDDVVVRDSRSPSGWSFRSSYHQAVLAYRRAFELRPQLLGAWREDAFAIVRTALFAAATQLRGGVLAQTREPYAAFPGWEGDTLSLLPYPRRDIYAAATRATPRTLTVAADHGREVFHELASRWAREDPDNSDALEALAVAQEAMGDVAALSTTDRARATAASAARAASLARREVWLRLKFGLPSRLDELARARALADSLLARPVGTWQDSAALVPLAVALGRPVAAARLARVAAPSLAQALGLPGGAVTAGQELLAYAAVGAPTDSIRALAVRVAASIRNSVAPQRQAAAQEILLQRSLWLALPVVRVEAGVASTPAGYLGDAVAALVHGDRARVHWSLARVDAARRLSRPSDLTADALYLEAWVLHAAGDDVAAAARLDPILAALPWTPPGTFDDPGVAGGLVRAMYLRAMLAHAEGDPATARRWGTALTILWQSSEPSLAAQLAEMRRLARPAGRKQ